MRKRSELELAKAALDESEMPYYVVIGNHDAQHPGPQDEPLFVPHYIEDSVDYDDALPRTETGKLARRTLRERYWQGRERRL